MLPRADYNLRPIQEADLERVLDWRNSPRVRACMYTDHLISEEEHRAWFQRLSASEFPTCLIFEHRGRPVGLKSFSQLDPTNGRCHWGFYLGETDVPKGSGSVMGFLAQEYIFTSGRFHKLCAEAFAFNEASVRYHKGLGFEEEGYFVQHVLKDGQYHDIVRFGILKDDWLKQREGLERKVFSAGGGS